jgi:hypothetical protein
MHIVVGLIFIMLGATCVGYLWAGGPLLEPKPPLLPLGILLTLLSARLAGRSRAPGLLARAGLGAGIVAIAWAATRWVLEDGEDTGALSRHFYLVAVALGIGGIVGLYMFARRLRPLRRLKIIDVLPLAAAGAALALGIVWLVGDDSRLRPCRLGNDGACDVVAGRLLGAAERTPVTPPTRWEEAAARVLDVQMCRGEPGPCAVRRYAVGTVALRAGRLDAARESFLRACEDDSVWCARAAQEKALPWTPEQRARLERSP